jgi:hypothetical protein
MRARGAPVDRGEQHVPVYLHPREPLPAQTRIYEGYSSLVGSAWGFAHDTATHAVRLMLSGLFDRHPGVQIILGHLGEGLPFLLPRLEYRLDKQREGVGLGGRSPLRRAECLCREQGTPGTANLNRFPLKRASGPAAPKRQPSGGLG